MDILGEKRPLFIAHTIRDTALVQKYVLETLEDDFKVPCVVDKRDFRQTENSLLRMIQEIKQCRKVVIVLTEESVQCNWISYQTLIALEQSQKTKRLSITVLLINLDLPDGQLFGILSSSTIVKTNFNSRNWKIQMCSKLLEDTRNNQTFVTGNLAVGQVWSHFTGYSRIVLPELANRIKQSKWYDPATFPVVLFELFPRSGQTHMKLQEVDDRIKYVGDLESIVVDRGTFVKRPYPIPVFSLPGSDSTEYYFTANFPNVLSVLYKMEKEPGKWLKTDRYGRTQHIISRGERSLQILRFFFNMNRLINHPDNKTCNNMSRLLYYDDNHEKLGDVLLKAIQKELPQQNQKLVKSGCLSADSHTEGSEDSSITRRKTVHLISGGSQREQELCEELKAFIMSHGYHIWTSEGGQNKCHILEEAVVKVKWFIFILTRDLLESPDCYLLNWHCRKVLHDGIENEQVRVIPVLHGVTENDLTNELYWMTCINTSADDYQNMLIKAIESDSISMNSSVPATDVATGLAWAYVINYLCITVDVHLRKLDTFARQKPGYSVCKKLLILVPGSCSQRPSLDKYENGHFVDPRFRQLETFVFDHIETVSGIRHRPYQLNIFSLQTANKEYILAAEYPNSVLCLKEMASMPHLSGLQLKDLHREAWRFKEVAEQALENTKVGDKVKFLYFDDERLEVADVLQEYLEYEGL